MKRRYLLGIFALLAFVFAGFLINASFASAYYFQGVRGVTQSVIDAYIDVGEPILQILFGGYGGWTGYLLFERFLLFILILSIIYAILARIPFFEEQKMVRWIVAIVIPLIAIRFINFEQISMIIQQYQLLAIILTSILPFILFFFFVHSLGESYPILRKIMWIFFIAVYIGLWSTTESGFQSAVFFWTFVAAGIIGLVFDRRIELWFQAREFARRERHNIDYQIAKLNEKINELNKMIREGSHPNPREARREISDLELQKKYLTRNRLIG
ncbi:MAG: hypothetical protein QXS38_02415 [Candidatus Pacearchaeota archaeon]